MSDLNRFTKIMERYLKARIPFISIRSSERARVLGVLRDLAHKINLATYVHTLSQGMRDLVHGSAVSEDRSVLGAIDFISSQFSQRQNLTYVLTEVSDIEDDTPTARYFYDAAMLAAETGGSIVVITSNPVWNPLARLGMSVTLDVPTEDEMLAIIREQINPYRGQIAIDWTEKEEKEAAAILTGISQIEAENVIATLLAKGKIEREDLIELSQVKDSVFSNISGLERIFIRDQELTVGGLEGLRKWLDHERPLLTADLRERGIRPPRGVLLVGVPGCGKSLSAKAIASSWNLPLYRLDLSTIFGQYVGQSEGRLKEALATADHVAPCVLWIDEIEKGLAGSQGDNTGVTNRLVGQFLFWLQEARSRVFVVATANDVSKLPPELLRRGRFDELFFVDLPTPEERREIINIYVHRGLKRSLDDRLLDELVRLSEGFAGADIEAAVRDVVKQAFLEGDHSITVDLFRRSFQNVVPLSQTSPEQIRAIRQWGRERAVPASGRPIVDESLGEPKRNLFYH
jgi:ATP-dependent 26S proteasome regulatory subunit